MESARFAGFGEIGLRLERGPRARARALLARTRFDDAAIQKKKKKQKFRDDFAAPPEVPQQGRGMERKVPDETHPLGVSKKYYFSSLAYSTESIRISKHPDNLLTKNATRSLSWRAQPVNPAHRYKTSPMSLSESLSPAGNYPFRISA